MNILSAENNFREGLAALVAGRPEEASGLFEKAMQAEKRHKVTKPQMRYLSYFGLSVAMARGGRCRDAVRACETAVRNEYYNPDLLFNLGKVYMMAGKTSKAMAVFAKGLQQDPAHKGIRSAILSADRRRRPPIGWLQRSHPVNAFLGRMRS